MKKEYIYFITFIFIFILWLIWISPKQLFTAIQNLNIWYLALIILLHPLSMVIRGLRLHQALVPFGIKDKKTCVLLLFFICGPLGYFLSAGSIPITLLLYRNIGGVAPLNTFIGFGILKLLDLFPTFLVLALFRLPFPEQLQKLSLFLQSSIIFGAVIFAIIIAIFIFFPIAIQKLVPFLENRKSHLNIFFAKILKQIIDATSPYAYKINLQVKLLVWTLFIFISDFFLTVIGVWGVLQIRMPFKHIILGTALQRFLAFIPPPPAEIGLQEISATVIFSTIFNIPAAKIGALALVMHTITTLTFALMIVLSPVFLKISLRDLLSKRGER